MLDTLASMPRQELIILLSVSVGSLVLLTILLTVLCIFCCRRANTARGRSNKYTVCHNNMFAPVEWYNVEKHALITMDDLTSNVKGSVDLDFIMKMHK